MRVVEIITEEEGSVLLPKDTLVIKNVDLNKLNHQRLIIGAMLVGMPKGEQRDALAGVVNMLDHWADRGRGSVPVDFTETGRWK